MKKSGQIANWIVVSLVVTVLAACASDQENTDSDSNDNGETDTTDTDGEWHPAYPVDNFEDGDDAIMEQTGDWITYADEENGASISPADDITQGVQSDGANGSNYAMHITGDIGSGASWGTGLEAFFEMDGDQFVPRDFASMGNEGLSVWAKGNCKLRACVNMRELVPIEYGGTCDEETNDECWLFHCNETDDQLTEEWTLFEMPFSGFEQAGGSTALDLSTIVSIQFTQDSETCGENTFDIWIDNVGVYGGDEWVDVWDGIENPADAGADE